MKAYVSLFTAPTSTGVVPVSYGSGSTGTEGNYAKAIIAITSSQTALDTVDDHEQRCFGFSDGSTDRSVAILDRDGQGTTDSYRRHSTGVLQSLDNADGSVLDNATVSSINTVGNVHLDYDTAGTEAYRSAMLVVAGAGVSAKVVDFISASGQVSVGGVGFRPEAIVFIGSHATGAPTDAAASNRFVVGVAGDAQMSVSSFGRDVVATSDTGRSISLVSAIRTVWQGGSGDPFEEASLVSFDADGFTVNFSTSNNDRYYSALCLQGLELSIQQLTAPTATGNQNVTFESAPSALMMLGTSQTTAETREGDSILEIGIGDGNSEVCMWGSSIDGEGTTDTKKSITNGAFIQHRNTAGTVINQANISSLGTTTVLNWTTAATAYESVLIGFMPKVKRAGDAIEVPAGSSVVKMAVASDGTKVFAAAAASGDLSLSSEKLVISGMPLSLYENSSGDKILAFSTENGTTASAIESITHGHPVVTETLSNDHVFVVEDQPNESGAIVQQWIWHGVPLSLNTDNSILIREFVTSAAVDETGLVRIGSIPFLIRRYGDNWYLVIKVE